MRVRTFVPLKSLGLLLLSAAVCLGQASRSAENEVQTAIALEQQGRNAEAEAAWRAFTKTHPKNAEAYAHIGFLASRQEHYPEAIAAYRQAMALDPSLPGLRMNLGLALFKSGEMKEAIAVFAPLRKSSANGSPEWVRLTTLMGLAHYGMGEYREAVPFLKEAIARDPQNLPFRLTLAHSCLWSKEYQCVLDVYREILTLNAESAEADMLAGEALDEMRDDLAATQRFRAAVKEDPKMPDVHFGLGYLLWRQSHYDEAAKEFQAELDNVPENAQALAFLADSYLRLNKTAEAQPLLEKAIQLDPQLERPHLDLGTLLSDGGHNDEAAKELEQAAKLAPDDPEVHWRLARVYQSLGKKEEARAEYQKTSTLKKAANDTIFSKLKAAQEKGGSGQATPGAAAHP